MTCDHGRTTLSLFVIMSAIILIGLSSIDFHTCLIWDASPRINAEVRYIVTLVGVAAAFVYIQQVRTNSIDSTPTTMVG
jgi:hypothetical protein